MRVDPLSSRPYRVGMEHAAVIAGEIAFERRGALGLIRLTRPDALNALTHGMVLAMRARLDEWAGDDRIACVAIVGEGRAFCAGGDIRAIYERGMAGEPFDQFFADEYALNIQIEGYPKPYVALVDGIAMGGGVGVAYHASHVVVGERARFAMPECGIGFFPDVGGTALLSGLTSGLGLYLGLCGRRIGPEAQVAAGLASAFVDAERHEAVQMALAAGKQIDMILGQERRNASGFGLVHHCDISPFFIGRDLHEIRTSLEAGQEAAWTSSPGFGEAEPIGIYFDIELERLEAKSPTSLHVAARQIALGATLTFKQAMGVEARIAHRMLRGHDFYEGIRAAIIDKGATPAWSPATLDEVTDEAVAAHFAPVEDGPLAAISALADDVNLAP